MHKTLRELPSLDFLRGFEAAGRTLSFTRAAAELFVTQSALSRQVKALEDALGVALFERRHRALALTRAGEALHREVSDSLAQIARAVDATRGRTPQPGVTLTTTVSFASLWIIPRLASFRARHPDIEVYVSADDRTVDLARGEVDVAVRYLAEHKVPEGAQRMFGERMLPVVSPQVLRQPRRRFASPADLRNHVLLHLDDPDGTLPWLNWPAWLAANGEPALKPAGSLRFRLYDQLIQAAVAGQGVALGRLPLLAEHLRDGRLVAPFAPRYDSARGYYVLVAPHAATRPDVAALVAWLADEAALARRAVLAPARRAHAATVTPASPPKPRGARAAARGHKR